MTGPAQPAAPPSAADVAAAAKQQRQTELNACLAEIQASLAKYGATFSVVEVITFPNGAAVHAHQVQVVSKG